MRFSPYDMHVERLAAARRSEAEEVRVVGKLLVPLLAAYVDGDGHTLPVGIIDLQGRVFASRHALLVHEAGCGI